MKTTDSIQFGEGNFLRAFVEYCIQILNEKTSFSGRVNVVQPIPNGRLDQLNLQDGKYHLFQEGIIKGRKIRDVIQIDCLDQMVNPYDDFEKFLELSENEDLTFVFSNTTEAGIVLNIEDFFNAKPPVSFPGKLTRLLYHRYKKFKGDPTKTLHIIPCELIDKNGDKLRSIILQLCKLWELEDDFVLWVEKNHFYNTLVDRIVPGYPKENLAFYKKHLSFEDELMITCEPFFLWVIEGNRDLLKLFPVDQLEEINVMMVPDLGIYRTRKVRILNGCHTTLVPVGLLNSTQTVSEALEDDFLKTFLKQTLFEEIIPSIDFDKKELEEYAHSVLERFSNPFIIHQLESICLNSISKFKVRVLPSLLSYHKRKKEIPQNLCFAFASLIYFYGKEVSQHPYPLKDDPNLISFFNEVWKNKDIEKVTNKILSNTSLWDQDLTEIAPLKNSLQSALQAIISSPKISEAYQAFKNL